MYESSCRLAEVNRVGICTSCKVDNETVKIVDQLLVKTIHTISDELEQQCSTYQNKVQG